MTIIYWIFVFLLFGLCITIHELGHLIVAIKCGLKPERFSVGFGPKIWGFEYKGVEYIISAIPFGGYVALPQLDPSDTPTDSKGNVLPVASPMARLLTAVAGPMANVILGFVLAIIITIAGAYRQAPQRTWQVTNVPEFVEPLAKDIGLKSRDKIISINNHSVSHGEWNTFWKNLTKEDVKKNNDEIIVKVLRQGILSKPQEINLKVKPQLNPEYVSGLRKGDLITAVNGIDERLTLEDFLHNLVLSKSDISLTIDRQGEKILLPSYAPAKNANATGLQVPHFSLDIDATLVNEQGQNFTLTNGKTISKIIKINQVNILGLTQLLSDTENILIKAICKDSETANMENALKTLATNPIVTLTVLDSEQKVQTIDLKITLRYLLGASIEGARIISVSPKSPAEKAGLKTGDEIIKVNQNELLPETTLTALVQKACHEISNEPKILNLTILRNKQILSIPCGVKYGFDFATNETNARPLFVSDYQELWHPSPWYQFSATMNRTIQTFKALFANKVRAQDMSGPVGIFQMTYLKVKNESFRGGLAFIIVISFSLAFFNLLPLPVLDGGHITFAIIEMIIRRRLPIKLLLVLQNAFAILLISFALYVTWYDIARVLRINGLTQRIQEVETEEVQPTTDIKPNK